MLEFTNALLKPFPWARRGYEHTLGLSRESEVKVTETDLTRPIASSVPDGDVQVQTDSEWNLETRRQIADLGGLYASADQASAYVSGLRTQLSSRVAESEKRAQEIEGALRMLKTSGRRDSTTSITIRGGDVSWVDNDERFYKDYGPLERVGDEGVFRLADSGHFSSIRSLGGFAGEAVIERSLGQLVTEGQLENVADGSRHTFWMGTMYAPAPVRADSTSVPWLPSRYRHGSAFVLTYYLDRPTLVSEVFVDPVSTEPFSLVAVSWTPSTVANALPDEGRFDTPGVWDLSGTATLLTTGGVQDSPCLQVRDVGRASYTFAIKPLLGPLLDGVTQAVTGDVDAGNRCQITYSLRGEGNLRAGARIVWLDAAGAPLRQTVREDFPTGFFASKRLVDVIPSGAASGRVEMGTFHVPASGAVALFDDVELLVGEKRWECNVRVDKPTTVALREVVTSGRFSLVFAQTSPRRETLSVEAAETLVTPIVGQRDLDPTLQKATQSLARDLSSRGPGTSVFAYRLGLKEVDLRYREHSPRGALVSLPVRSDREIRRIWVNMELGRHHTDGVDVLVYPFAQDVESHAVVPPYLVGDIEADEMAPTQIGRVLHVYSTDEIDAGWANVADLKYVVKPRPVSETFSGTNRNGRLSLSHAPHLRLPRVFARNHAPLGTTSIWGIQAWLERYAIFPTQFDPNAETLYGVSDQASDAVIALRERQATVPSLSMLDLVTAPGYVPVRVTVRTARWTAHPDTFGRPDRTRVRSVDAERLTETTVVETVVSEGSSDTGDAAVTRTAAVERSDTFKTKYAPLITGPTGTRLRVFARASATGQYLPIPQSDYSVDPSQGVVKMLKTLPTEYDELWASYQYVSYANTEDFFSSVIGNLTEGASGIADIVASLGMRTRTLPITRNMTDYLTGKVPTLRPPNFDQLSKEYYPVIEYFVTPQGELVFSRDFSPIGDLPAEIDVEWETLGVEPRVAVRMTRPGSPSVTPTVSSVTLHVREGSSAPEREAA